MAYKQLARRKNILPQRWYRDGHSDIAITGRQAVCWGHDSDQIGAGFASLNRSSKGAFMTIDLTRRTLLHLAGASSLSAAAIAAAQAEGTSGSGGPTFANRTPIRIGMATLRVRNLDLVADYYRDAIGLTVMQRTATGARLGAGGVPLLDLSLRAGAPAEARNAAGLYHTAFLMPTRKDLARWLVHAAKNKIPLSGFADHLVSESVYLDDPEGNGIEVYADRAPETWKWDGGSVAMATDQLDINGLLALTDTRTTNYAKAPDDLRIGHMHLRVGDLEQADRFYGGAIGFDPTRKRSGAAFLSSGRYHHHLGINVWQSAGAGPRDDTATGLAWFSLEVAAQEILVAQGERLRQAGAQAVAITNGIETTDPWGTKVRLIKV
jgi:catechol 2,3-dioxygenase